MGEIIAKNSCKRIRCDGGYVQIVDGYRDSNQSNRDAPGFHCGEIDSPKTFISETPHVKIVFHADAYGPDMYMHFDASVKQQGEVSSRLVPLLWKKESGHAIYVET
ncbi:hypothetical protein HPB50_007845 [Hyalomma asiaticum]|uniref:Uncharacterized protein n=1 Tax=Hyalomma asiaticum TaxID=266040 RepID=A0ACB7T965_HYAAI|nr:hypothetical protein HPB50_007845 [Hyalomma asiaticum]